MAEENDGQEKTEEPTSRRLDKAREEGQVPRSKELNTTIVLLAGAIGLLWFGPWGVEHISQMAHFNFSVEREAAFDPAAMFDHLKSSVFSAALALAPWLLMVLFAAFLGPISLGGWLFSTKSIMPKLDRLNPLSGLKRMFSMNSVVELVKSVAKVFVVGLASWLVLKYYFNDALLLQRKAFQPAIAEAVHIILWSIIFLCAATVFIALADVPWQLYSHTKKLRMSLQEIKDEFKESEGRPEVKGKIRQLQREMSQRRMMAEVPTADVVITNPTHYSVALKYDSSGMSAPILVAKGTDQVALKIREIAKENNVPQMQAPPLARALYTHAKIGDEIPEGLYVAVAQVLAYIYQMDQFAKGKGPKPERKPDMPIPRDLRVDPQ
jgi:flagellar biosynthetic protein FlhB